MSPLDVCLIAFLSPPVAGIVLWTAGALYYDAGSGKQRGILLVLAWLLFCAASLWQIRPWWLAIAFPMVGFVLVLRWWWTQKPCHDRNWDPNFAVLPSFQFEGNRVIAQNVRDTEYRTLEDYDPHFRTFEWRLDDLQQIDLLLLYWGSPWMSHPILVFEFATGPRVCFSIEVRYRRGDEYGIIRGLFRQNELMYVVTTERDAILRRTLYTENGEIFLYRLHLEKGELEDFFREYVEQTNAIVGQPRWYNAVTANCTTTIYRQRRGKLPWDWRLLFNGHIDRMLYERQRLDQSVPFEELRAASRINERANEGARIRSDRAFGDWIRRGLPADTPPGHPSCFGENPESAPMGDGSQSNASRRSR